MGLRFGRHLLWFPLVMTALPGCLFDREGLSWQGESDATLHDGRVVDGSAPDGRPGDGATVDGAPAPDGAPIPDGAPTDGPPVQQDAAPDAPAAPTNLIATPVSFHEIQLVWTDNSNNETRFDIERSLNGGGSFTPHDTVTANVTLYNDTGLTQNTQYCYRVRAANAAGESGFSNTACTTTLPATLVPTWTAYNDLAWVSGQLSLFITTITSPNTDSGLPSSGALTNYLTAASTGVTLTVTGGLYNPNTGPHESFGREHAPGTDAGDVFSGYVSMKGLISYEEPVTSTPLVLSFSGLDPTRRYEVVFLSDRDSGSEYTDWERACLVTIGGVSSFTNESSDGLDPGLNPLFSGPGDDSTRLPNDNNNSWIARFTHIDAGGDGTFTLTIQHDGATAGGSLNKGKYANAIMLREYEYL